MNRARRSGSRGTQSRTRSPMGRGRPPKFGRPSQVVALTLPQDVLDLLRTVHQDPGWAIVRLVESVLGKAVQPTKAQTAAIAELVHLPGRRALIVVQPRAFRRLHGVSMIPLADGRAFLAFDRDAGLADLEVAILDRLEAPGSSAERTQLMQVRDIVRAWRRASGLAFRTKSIIVVEGTSGVDRRPLPPLHDGKGPADTDGHRGRRR